MSRITFEPLCDSWALVAILTLALACAVYFAIPRDSRVLTPRRRRVELVLRWCVVALFAVLFARPSTIAVDKEELPASVYFVCDASESMSVRDAEGGKSRYEAMVDAFASAREPLKKLCERFDVHAYAFGDGFDELEIEDGVVAFPASPTGLESALGDALARTLSASIGARAVGTAIFSDGAQRTRDPNALGVQEATLRLRDAERVVDAAIFGTVDGAANIDDVAIADLRANDRVFVGTELVVLGRARALGRKGREVELNFELETAPGQLVVVDTLRATPDSDDASIPFRFTCRIETPGEWKLTVSSPVLPGEALETNNELSTFVKALDGGVNLLYVEGTRRYEQNFLRAALDSSSDIQARYWRPPISSLIAKNPKASEAELAATLTKTRKSLIDAFFTEGRYATYVLGDVDSTAFQPNELEALAKLVENGAGLVVLAGERSLSLGGYAGTALEDAIPVELTKSARLPLDADLSSFERTETSDRKARYPGEFQAVPVDGARDAFAVSLSADAKKNAALWKETPTLTNVYRLGRLKPGAEVVLTGESKSGKRTAPILITQRYGLGRVAVVATDSTWRWRMRGKADEHAKFWRQLIMWSAKIDETLEGELAVELESGRFPLEDAASFQVVYRPKAGERLDEVKAEATLVSPDGTRRKVGLTADEAGVWRGTTPTLTTPGDYRIEATVEIGDAAASRAAQARFSCFERNLELERPGAAPDVLARLADATQGVLIPPNDLGAYFESLLAKSETIVDYRETKKSLYDAWFLFALVVALMTCDWLLRKKGCRFDSW